ncbi:MAG: hypothetical protein ACR2QE_14340 [Acidimicrobiales bacterium]
MLLGLSGLSTGNEIDHHVVGGDIGDGGVRDGALLTRFAEAIHHGDDLVPARRQVADELGVDVMIDAAAVCANFAMMTRIADGTGTPLDEGSVAVSAELRSDLALDGLESARLPH